MAAAYKQYLDEHISRAEQAYIAKICHKCLPEDFNRNSIVYRLSYYVIVRHQNLCFWYPHIVLLNVFVARSIFSGHEKRIESCGNRPLCKISCLDGCLHNHVVLLFRPLPVSRIFFHLFRGYKKLHQRVQHVIDLVSYTACIICRECSACRRTDQFNSKYEQTQSCYCENNAQITIIISLH